jgi:hypothetical protein
MIQFVYRGAHPFFFGSLELTTTSCLLLSVERFRFFEMPPAPFALLPSAEFFIALSLSALSWSSNCELSH